MQKHIQSFITENIVGLLSTCNDQVAHGVPVFYLYLEPDNAFYFITKTESKKYFNLSENRMASLTIFSESPPTVFTAECRADILEFSFDKYAQIINSLIDMHSTQDYYPSPISTLKKGVLKLIKLEIIGFNYNSYGKDIEKLKK